MAIYLGDKIVGNISQKSTFVINVTLPSGQYGYIDEGVTADRTFEEITAAYNAGQSIFVKMDGYLIPLRQIDKDTCYFESLIADALDTPNYQLQFGCTIDSDNYVEAYYGNYPDVYGHIEDFNIHVTKEEKENWENKGYQVGDIRFSMNSLGDEWVYINGSGGHTVEEYPEFVNNFPVLWDCKRPSNEELQGDDYYFREFFLFCDGKWWGLNTNGYLYSSSDGRNWTQGKYIGSGKELAAVNNQLVYWNLTYSSGSSDNITYYLSTNSDKTSFSSYTLDKPSGTYGRHAKNFGYWNGTYFILGDQYEYNSGYIQKGAIFTNSTLTSTNWATTYTTSEISTFIQHKNNGYILEKDRAIILQADITQSIKIFIFNQTFNSTPTIITIDDATSSAYNSNYTDQTQILKFKDYYFIFTFDATYYSQDLTNWTKSTTLFRHSASGGYSNMMAQTAFVCNDSLYFFQNVSNNVQSYQLMTELFDVKTSVNYGENYMYISWGVPNEKGDKFVVTGIPTQYLATIVNDTFSFPTAYATFGSSSINNGQLKVR